MKKSEENRLKCVVYESTLSTADAVPLPQWGRQRYEDAAIPEIKPFPRGEGKEEAASPPKKEANPASLRSAAPSKGRGSRGHSLLPMEGGAPKGRRLDGESGMKESEIVSSAPLYENTRAPRIYMGRCPKVCGEQISRLRFSDIIRLTANDKDVSLRSKCRYGRV